MIRQGKRGRLPADAPPGTIDEHAARYRAKRKAEQGNVNHWARRYKAVRRMDSIPKTRRDLHSDNVHNTGRSGLSTPYYRWCRLAEKLDDINKNGGITARTVMEMFPDLTRTQAARLLEDMAAIGVVEVVRSGGYRDQRRPKYAYRAVPFDEQDLAHREFVRARHREYNKANRAKAKAEREAVRLSMLDTPPPRR